ncbi:MAG: hypothetical protein M5U34_31400 [Chloroflexi bacterium]|nr:hypothetical protein [Chloroflexota bacterium]
MMVAPAAPARCYNNVNDDAWDAPQLNIGATVPGHRQSGLILTARLAG